MWRLGSSVMLVGCGGLFAATVNEATSPSADPACIAGLAHLRQCDERVPERSALCTYSDDGRCAPYINAEQSRCLRESTCEAVRAALEDQHWLCGMSLARQAEPNRSPRASTGQ